MIRTALIALFVSGSDAAVDDHRESPEQLAPSTDSTQEIANLEKLHEEQRLKHEKLEAEAREIERDALAINRARWHEVQVPHYRYNVSYTGAWVAIPPVTVTVRAGQFVSAEFVDKRNTGPFSEAAAIAMPYSTVPTLFAVIDGLLNQEEQLPRVHYDQTYGFPLHIANDRFSVSDDEFSIQVWDFQVLE